MEKLGFSVWGKRFRFWCFEVRNVGSFDELSVFKTFFFLLCLSEICLMLWKCGQELNKNKMIELLICESKLS